MYLFCFTCLNQLLKLVFSFDHFSVCSSYEFLDELDNKHFS